LKRQGNGILRGNSAFNYIYIYTTVSFGGIDKFQFPFTGLGILKKRNIFLFSFFFEREREGVFGGLKQRAVLLGKKGSESKVW
jgi:hypothetical protein